MRIVSYNVNGLRPRLASPRRTLGAFLDSLDADIICLQETKIARHELTADVAVAEGYESFFSCTRTFKKGRIGYSGVATFCRVGQVQSSTTSPTLPIAADEGFTGLLHRSEAGEIEGGKGRVGCYEEVAMTELSTSELLHLDSEGRCLITDHGSFVLFNLYCPRVQCGDVERLDFKMNFFRTLRRRWDALLKRNRRIIAVGDFNVSPYPIDSCDPGPEFDRNSCRMLFRSLLQSEGGPFWDVFRYIHQERKEAYTCWSQASGAEEFNYGTRIDLVLAAGSCNHGMLWETNGHGFVECEVQDCDILNQFRRVKPDAHPRWQGGRSLKLEGSDHAPIVVQLRDQLPVEAHQVPPLAARFMPEIRGRQQNLVSLLKRRSPSGDVTDAESNPKSSRLGQLSEANESPTGNSKSSTSVGKPSNSVNRLGKNGKMQGLLTSKVNSKKQGMRAAPQQRDLRAFFVSSSPTTEPLTTDEADLTQSRISSSSQVVEPLAMDEADLTQSRISSSSQATEPLDMDEADLTQSLSVTEGSQSLVENVEVEDSTVVWNELNGKDEEVQGCEGSQQIGTGIMNLREDPDTSISQVESTSGKFEEMDADGLIAQVEQIRKAEESKPVSASLMWSRIKQKMARAGPLCKGHDEPCVARVVKKAGPNKGRGFYVCARAAGPSSNPEARCNHFEWSSSGKKGTLVGQNPDLEQPHNFVK